VRYASAGGKIENCAPLFMTTDGPGERKGHNTGARKQRHD